MPKIGRKTFSIQYDQQMIRTGIFVNRTIYNEILTLNSCKNGF